LRKNEELKCFEPCQKLVERKKDFSNNFLVSKRREKNEILVIM
jgi:hypothetical protein